MINAIKQLFRSKYAPALSEEYYKHKIIPVNEIYACVQGEGKFTGIPHLLIRFTGCKLRCQFANSFCDTWHNSWKPERGNLTLSEIVHYFEANPHIQYTMITGGGPTSHPQLLQEIVNIAKRFGHIVTIETEGSEFVPTNADCISLSPKLSNSTPRPGTYMPHLNRQVTEADRSQHEKWRRNYDAMEALIEYHEDYQLKPVISTYTDLIEFKKLQKKLGVPNYRCWLMPEGIDEQTLQLNRQWLMNLCTREGYNYTDRLHIVVYGNKRGV